ncbi:hypothetical protein KTD26_33990, partial [Burkholderia multivorans]|uniref:hypothetical protein n=1 Tax=Burkholderia multivorans TaxID=87883 RepID=UPI001C21ADB1
VHNSSSMIGLAISSVSVVPMPEVNSSPRKLTAPRGLFETVSYSNRCECGNASLGRCARCIVMRFSTFFVGKDVDRLSIRAPSR